jgi:septal ring factor EnvC (AmiA/AmiB activator)
MTTLLATSPFSKTYTTSFNKSKVIALVIAVCLSLVFIALSSRLSAANDRLDAMELQMTTMTSQNNAAILQLQKQLADSQQKANAFQSNLIDLSDRDLARLIEIRSIRKELDASKEKIATLKSQIEPKKSDEKKWYQFWKK